MSDDFHVLFLIGATEYDATAKVLYDGVSIEETLGAAAVATFKLRDTATPEAGPFPDLFPNTTPGNGGVALERLDVKITIDGQSEPVFRGMVMVATGDIRPGEDFPTYTLHCTDYQAEVFDRRLVGTPNGSIWWRPDATSEYTAIDPAAVSGATDRGTIQDLFESYCVWPAIDTDTFVHEYADGLTNVFHWDRATLRSAINDVSAYSGYNVQDWIDSSLRLHHVALPRWFEELTPAGVLARMLPETLYALESAPADINNDAPDWTSTIACRAISWTFDYNPDTWEYFVNGGIGYAYNGGDVDLGGSGWWPSALPAGTLPQALLDAPEAWNAATKAAAAGRSRNACQSGILRGRFAVGHQNWHPDGWHVGQTFRLTQAALPRDLNGRRFVIQRVVTTLIPGKDIRVYGLEWGESPMQRLSSRKTPAIPKPDLPGRVLETSYSEASPIAGATVRVTGQLTADDGTPRRVAGVVVHLGIEEWDEADAVVTPTTATLSASDVTTDTMGRWQTDLTVGSNPGHSYRVAPETAA